MPATPAILSTLYEPHQREWAKSVELLDPASLSKPRLWWRLFHRARNYRGLVLNGSIAGYRDLMGALLIARRRCRPTLLLADCTWKVGETRWARWLRRLGLRLIDGPQVYYCVHSSEEQRIFPRTWGVDPGKVFYTPWYHGVPEAELRAPVSTRGGIFAGGNSLRDYPTLIEAAGGLLAKVTICTTTALPPFLPPNVRRTGPIPRAAFLDALRHATVVAVPLQARQDRCAGQCVFLDAMALGKLVIVTDTMGVRDYVEDGRTGLIVPPNDPGALRESLAWALAHPEESARIARRAQETVRSEFSQELYFKTLAGILYRLL